VNKCFQGLKVVPPTEIKYASKIWQFYIWSSSRNCVHRNIFGLPLNFNMQTSSTCLTNSYKLQEYKSLIISHIKTCDYKHASIELTFKLPQQEHGVSILESSSSSWHILHSASFPEHLTPIFNKAWSTSALVASEDAACIARFMLSIATSNVDSVSNRSTSKSKWSPIFAQLNTTIHFNLPNNGNSILSLPNSLYQVSSAFLELKNHMQGKNKITCQ